MVIKREKVTFRVSAKDIYQTHKSALVISLLSIILISLIVILASSIEQGPDVTINNNAREMSFDLNDNSINLGFSLVNPDSSNSFSESSEVPTESFEVVMKENTKDYSKWGYKVKLNSPEFTAKVPISSDKTITISSSDSLTIGNKILSFSDLTNTGYTVTIESIGEYNVNVYITRDFSDVISSNAHEINSSLNDSAALNLTSANNNSTNESSLNATLNASINLDINATNLTTDEPLTPSPVAATDIENIEYEDTDNSNSLSLGDILYLDPILTSMSFSDISIGTFLRNATAESNFTHLTLIGDTSNPWRGFNYTARNSPPYLVDDDNSYASFDGVDDYIISPNLTRYFSSETVSLSVWFKANTAGIVVDEVGQTTINTAWHDSQIEVLSNGSVVGRVWSLSPVNLGIISFDNKWHHAVIRYNKTSTIFDGFLDGTEASSDVLGDRTAPWESGASEYYALGSNDSTNLGSGAFFNGSVDNFLVFNKSLNSSEVTTLYNLGRKDTSYTDPALVSAWRFDNTNLSNAYDSIGINNGTFMNGSQYGYDALGLVAYYPFDVPENVLVNKTYDYTGNNNDGTLYGGVTFNTTNYLYGKFYAFDGSNDYIGANSKVDVNSNQMTLSYWVKSSKNSENYLGNMRWNGVSGYVVGLYAGVFRVGNGTTQQTLDLADPTLDTWDYYAYTVTMGDKIIGYKNGVNTANTSLATFPGSIGSGAYTLKIGEDPAGGSYFFNGSLDEVMIFNRALNSSEISDIYNNQSRRFSINGAEDIPQESLNGVSNPYNTTIISVNLTANFTNTITPMTNMSARIGQWNINQNVSGSAYKNYDLGEHWAQFSGSGSYINITNSSSLNNLNNTLTISAWIKLSRLNQFHGIVGKTGSIWADGSFGFRVTSSNVVGFYNFNSSSDGATIDGAYNELTSSAINSGTWYHVVAVHNGTTKFIYINGILNASVNYAGGIRSNNQTLSLGAYTWGSGLSYLMNGSLDEVMIFNRSLSSSEISSLYSQGRDIDYYNDSSLVSWYGFDSGNSRDKKGSNNGVDTSVIYNQSIILNGLLSYYHFDEYFWNGTTGEVKDALGKNNATAMNYSVAGRPNITESGAYFRGGNFKGSGDIRTALSPAIPEAGNYSVSVQAYAASTSSLYLIDDYNNQEHYIYTQYSGNNGSFCFGFYNKSNSVQKGVCTAYSYPIRNWYNVVGTYNHNEMIRIYVNGTFANNASVAGYVSKTFDDLVIGGRGSTGQQDFVGFIDEVMIFNRSLSPSEISELYVKGRANWNYTQIKNLTSSGGQTQFNITPETTNILPEFIFTSDSNNFYSPSLFSTSASPLLLNITSNIFPTVTIGTPSNGSYWNNATPFFNISSSELGSGSMIPNLDGSLISWWRMDDLNSSGGVVDFMGRNNGTNNGAVQIANGKFAKAMNFTGTSYINVLDAGTSSLDLVSNFSISLWVNPATISNCGAAPTCTLLNKETSYEFGIDNTGNIEWALYTAGNWEWHQTAATAPVGTWTHLTMIYNGSYVTFYKNGLSVGSIADPEGGLLGTNNDDLKIGARGGDAAAWGYYNGSIDDVLIFNRSITAAEALSLYNASKLQHGSISLTNGTHNLTVYSQDVLGNVNFSSSNFTIDTIPATINIFSPTNGTVTNNPNVTFNVSTNELVNTSIIPNLDGSLISWWRMDELNSSLDILDYLGRINGIRSGNATPTDIGRFGKALNFDGVDDYVSRPYTALGVNHPFTMSAWIKTSNTFSYEPGITSFGYGPVTVMQTNGKVKTWWYNGATYPSVSSSSVCNDGKFHNVLTTFNGTTVKIYVDGNMEGSLDSQVQLIYSGVYAGVEFNNGNKLFNGTIDDVIFFNRSLESSEVLALYNGTSYNYSINLSDSNHSLVAYVEDIAANVNVSQINFTTDTTAPYSNLTYPLNKSISNYAINFTANLSDNLAGIKNATLTVFDLSGNQWLNFNGSGSRVQISGISNVNKTLSAWIRVPSTGVYSIFNDYSFQVVSQSLRQYNGTANVISTGAISLNSWQHVVQVNYDNGTICYYINGVVSGCPYGGVSKTLTQIGVYAIDTISQAFNGSIDEIRIYNRTLNSSEIEQIYYSKLNSNSNLPSNGLISWYNMQPDSSNLTRLIDRVAGVNNGTIYGATYTSSYSSVITYASNTLTTTVGIVINVVEGVYNWFYDVFDVVGNEYITSNYTVIVDTTSPSIEFISPTPLNNSGVDENFFVNVSMRETHLANVTYSWNGTNYTINLFNNNASNYDVNPFNLSKGLVSYWHFDEPSWNGTTGEVKDVMGRNNGSAANSANVSSGVHGTAASFDGDAQYISVGNDSNMNPSRITISAWVKVNTDGGSYKGIVTKWNSSDTRKTSYDLRLGYCYSNELFFEINNGSSTYGTYACSQSNNLAANRWYYVVGMFNGTDIKLYINGTLAYVYSSRVLGSINSSISNVYIGQYDNSLYRYRFPGSIDEVMIYNRSLTDDEIKSLYNSRLGVYYNPDRYTFENYSNNKTFMSLESPGLDWTNWTLTVNQSGLASGLNYTYLASARDLAVNTNMTEIRSIKGSIIPNFYSVTQNPFANNTNYLDPGLNVTISTEVYDPDGNQESAILQWRNSSSSDWTNQTMNNITNISLYTTFSINLTLPSYEDNITYRIWANDSSGVNNVSRNYTFNSFWDCTWNQTTQLGAFAGWDENKYLTNITIYNTGDPEYSERNCTLDFRTTYDLMEGRVYLDNSKYKRKQYLGLVAKSNISIEINATFLSEVKEETAKITFEEISGVSNSSSRNSTATLISTTGGPYLYQKIEPDVSSYLYLTPQNFSLGSYIRDIVADGYVNTTAYDVSFNWSLPYGFLVLAGTPNISFENLSNNSLNYNNINITFNETNLGYLTPQIVSVYIYASGHNSSNDLIPHSGNRTLLMQQSNITLLCYNETDGVCVPNCGYSKDPDCVESAASSGGGGGGGSANNGREEQSKAGFELLSGRVQVFQLPIENKYPYAKENLKISVSGINSQYIKISPDTISRIDPMSSKNITVTITAPAYFSKGEYKLTFVITGDLLSGGTKEVVTERKLVTLYIVELPKEETSSLINESWRFIAEMNSSKMILSDVLTLYSEMQNSYNKMDYISVKNNYEKIKEIRDSAFSSKQIIAELESKIKQAEKDGISVLETKKILYTSESAFARGDYSLAKERLNEAKLTFAIETKGEFNLLYVVKNNPIKSGASILGFALFAFAASIALRLSLYKKKLKALTEEEKLLLELMKVIQRECFTNNHMSMDEYGQAMSQYETRLSKAIEEKIEAEAKIANLMKIKGRKRALEDERKRLVELVKKIQEDYMNKGIIETRIYENMIKSYSGRLAEVEEELTFFDAQEALSQNKWSRRLLRVIGIRK